jgi:hypothetical protein
MKQETLYVKSVLINVWIVSMKINVLLVLVKIEILLTLSVNALMDITI